MFGKVQVGLNPDEIHRIVEKALRDNSARIQAALRAEVAKTDNIDEKIVLAISAAVQNILPNAIATAIGNNNRGMARTLEELAHRR